MGSNFIESTTDLDNIFVTNRGIQPYTNSNFDMTCGRAVNFDVNNTSVDLRGRYEPIFSHSPTCNSSVINRSGISITANQGSAGSTGFVSSNQDLNYFFAASSNTYTANVTISANQPNGLTLSTYLSGTCALNFSFFDAIIVTIASGVTISGGLLTGSGIPGLTLINNGTIYGAGGSGGDGDSTRLETQNSGYVGGDAIYAQQNFILYNNGRLYGGGGGGGGGGFSGPSVSDTRIGGGGGGGGQGVPGGRGGPGARSTDPDGGTDGNDGNNGSISGPGTGGYGGGTGGTGGTWGNAGSRGSNGTQSSGANGGDAGYAVNYNNFTVTVETEGTVLGSLGNNPNS